MKLLLAIMFLAIAGCTTSGPVMNPIQAATCDVETTITQAFGSTIVSQCAGTDAVACGNAVLVGLGNVNVCATPIPQPQTLSVTKWKTIGDVTKGDLKSLQAKDVQSSGIVGSIVCPIAYNTIMGLVTGAIPKACGCTQSFDAGVLGAALVQACVTVIPI